MATSLSLKEAWLWESRLLLPMTGLLLLICSMMTVLLYSRYGHVGLYFLLSTLAVILYFIRNIRLGRKVEVLRGCISAQNGEVADALIFIRNKVSAGIAILRESELILIPVSGRRSKLQLGQLLSVRPVCTFHEKHHRHLFGKQAFLLENTKHSTYGFAVASSIARRWSALLTVGSSSILQE